MPLDSFWWMKWKKLGSKVYCGSFWSPQARNNQAECMHSAQINEGIYWYSQLTH